MNGLFDSLSNKFTSSVAGLIPKAVKESFTNNLCDDVKKAFDDTLQSYADINSGCSNAQNKNLDMQFIINGVTEFEDSHLKQIEKDTTKLTT